MNAFILIIIVQASLASSPALTSVNQEFTSFESCEKARVHIANNINKNNWDYIVTQGCFKK